MGIYYDEQKMEPKAGKIFAHLGILIVVLILLGMVFSSTGTVRAGYRGVRTQFGSVIGTVDSGLYFRVPFIQKVHKVSTQTQVVYFDRAENALGGASKDLQSVTMKVIFNYKVLDSKVVDIFTRYQTVANHQTAVIEPILRDAMKATSAKYTAEELVTKRAEFVAEAERILRDQIQAKADLVVFERLNVTDIDFSGSFNKAIEAKVTAEQDALAAKNKLEQVKFEAEQRVAGAKAEAEAIRIQAQAVTQQGGKDYVQLKAIEKWNGHLPQQMIPGSTVPFINLTK